MKAFVWTEAFSVGNVLMDTHHRVFFEMVREFSDWSNMDSGAIQERIKFLVDYCFMHLGAEERLMEQAGYPLLESHKAIHCEFIQRVLAIREAYENTRLHFRQMRL